MNTALRTLLLLSTGVALSACLSPQPKDGDDDGDGDGGSGEGTTVAAIQQGEVAEDSLVTLTDVVVTTPVTTEGGGFYVQDAGGGEWSGIYIFLQGSFDGLNLAVGDELTLTGTYTEFYDFSEITVTGVADMEITGTGTVTATDVASATDWEPYEGVLVSLLDQTVESCVDSYGEVDLSAGIEMDDGFFTFETEKDATYDSITGVISYGFERFKINPRSADDLAGYTAGSGCSATVAEIQQDGWEGGVTIEDVVVTSDVTGNGEGFFVQDAGGGEWSGIYVYVGDSGVTATRGDVVSITGAVTEYYDFTELTVFEQDDIEVTGSGEPTAVTLTEAPDDWEVYEGVLVTLEAPTATDATDEYGTCPLDYGINLDDWFYEVDALDGTTWDSVTGLVSYAYEEWAVQPRDEDDVVGQEGGKGGGGGEVVSIVEIQDGTVAEGTDVTIEGAIVTTGPDNDGEGFFIQDAGGGDYSGIYVFYSGGGLDVSIGDEITIEGEVSEFYDFTQLVISGTDAFEVTGTGTPVITTLTEAPSDWEVYESGLVELVDLTVTSDESEYGECDTDWGDLVLDDLLYAHGASDGSSYSSVTGAISFSYDAYRVNPRQAEDLVAD